MKKYTLKTIKQTICYKANIEVIKVIYPNHWKLFAQELMIAANERKTHFDDLDDIHSAFYWKGSPQGHDAWSKLDDEIYRSKA